MMHSARTLRLGQALAATLLVACAPVTVFSTDGSTRSDGAPSDGPAPDAVSTDARAVTVCSLSSPLAATDVRPGLVPALIDPALVPSCAGAAVSLGVFTVSLPARSYFTVTATRASGRAPDLVTLPACDATTCGTRSSPALAAPTTDTLALRNDTDAPASLTLLAVDTEGTAPNTPFDLSAVLTTEPASATCATPVRVTASTVLAALDPTAAPTATRACDPTARRTVYAAVDLAPYHRVAVSAGSVDTMGRVSSAVTSATLLSGCDARATCLAPSGMRTAFLNDSSAARTVTLALGLAPDAPLDTRITARIDVTQAAPYASCMTAPSLAAGSTTVTDTTPGAALVVPCITQPDSPTTQFFTVTVAPHEGLRATASGTAGRLPTLALVSDCANPMCAQIGPSGTSVRAFNNTNAPETLQLIATGAAGVVAPYTLALASYEPPANVACAMATAISSSTVLVEQDGAEAFDLRSSRCLNSDAAPSVFYALSVPPGNAVIVDAAPHAAGNPTLRLLFDCVRASGCLASAQGFGGSQATDLRWLNEGATTATPVLAVAARDSTLLFDLDVTIAPPSTNATCASARAVTDGTVLHALAFADGRDAVTACRPEVNSGALYFTTSIDPGARLVATASTPAGRLVPLVRVLPSCAAAQCLAVSATGDIPARATLENPGTSALPVVIAVAPSDMLDVAGSYDLAVDLVPQTFTVSRPATACDDLTMSATTTTFAANGDDVIAEPVTLPFAFPYFGGVVTTASPTSDGQLLFGTASAPVDAMGRAPFLNRPIPFRQPIANFAAPFWDDLFAPANSLRYRAFDDHVTFGWVSVLPYNLPNDTLTFQVKLFPDGALEFHYCSIAMPTDPRNTGSSATVGLQNATGTRGVEIGFDAPGTIDTMHALRFVPRTP